MQRRFTVGIILALVLTTAPAEAQTPHFDLLPSHQMVDLGQTLSVFVLISNLTVPLDGYSITMGYDNTKLMATDILPGPFLPFNTFFPLIQSDHVVCGAINFPTGLTLPPPLGPGAGNGVIAQFDFQVIGTGPIHLDLNNNLGMSGGNIVVVSGASVHPTLSDHVVQAQDPNDPSHFLGVNGVPNPGHTVNLDIFRPANAGHVAVTLASLGTNGIGAFGQTVPLTQDFVFNLSLNGLPPFRNVFNQLNFIGMARTYFDIPAIPAVVGFKIHFATVIVPPAAPPLLISAPTFVEILSP